MKYWYTLFNWVNMVKNARQVQVSISEQCIIILKPRPENNSVNAD